MASQASQASQIELEYKITEGSDAIMEVANCVQYCTSALALVLERSADTPVRLFIFAALPPFE